MNAAMLDVPFDEVDEDDPLIGIEIGNRYRIEGQLGVGGMGVVYAATQVEIERPVAIKVMKIVEPTAMERFRREAVTIGRLGHPSIIDLYDVGRLPDGRPYMVMPRVSGPDLGELVDGGKRLDVEEVIRLLEGPASALDEMHRAGFLHRDIKPDNLMIDERQSARRVLLLDFGLAQMMRDDRRRLTRDGLVSGTPHYISPEAARGDDVGPQSDVYSLAAVAYELMTGRAPFEAGGPMKILLDKVQKEPPSLASAGVEVSDTIEEAMALGLAVEPVNRFASATGFIEGLRAAAREPEPALSSSPEPEDEIPGERSHRWVIPALLLLPLLAFVIWLARPTPEISSTPLPEPEPTAAAPSTELEAEIETETETAPAPASIDEPVTAAASEASSADEPETGSGDEPAAGRGDERATPADDEPAPARRRARLARASEAEEPAAEPAPAADMEHAPDPSPDTARARVRDGTRALLAGRVPMAIQQFRAGTLAAPSYAPAWRGLGLANERIGRSAEARRAYQRYLALAPRAADASTIRGRLAEL